MNRKHIFAKATREKVVDLWNDRCAKIEGVTDMDGVNYLRVGLGKTLYGRAFLVDTAAGGLRFSMSIYDTAIFLARRFNGDKDPARDARLLRIANTLLNRTEGFHREVSRSGKSNHYLFAEHGDNANPEVALRWITHQIDTIARIAKTSAPEIA